MLSRAAELVNGRAEPLKGAIEFLKSETEVLKYRTSRFLRRTTKLSRQRAIVALHVCQKKVITDWGNAIVNTTFGLLMGSLVVLLSLSHAGVPIVGK
jgi:hypothetical protein